MTGGLAGGLTGGLAGGVVDCQGVRLGIIAIWHTIPPPFSSLVDLAERCLLQVDFGESFHANGSRTLWPSAVMVELVHRELAQAWEELSERFRIKSTGRKIRTPILYTVLRHVLSPVHRLLNIGSTGINLLPRNQPCIIAANHLSHLDPLYIIAITQKKLFYLTKDDHFKRKHTAWFMRSTGQIETARERGGQEALSSAIDVLDSGLCLGIFPEGTRSRKTEAPYLSAGKTGVARIAASSPDTPVIPIALSGTRNVMTPKIHKLPRIWRRVTMNLGEGITWNEWLCDESGGNVNLESIEKMKNLEEPELRAQVSKLYRKFTDQLMETLLQLGAP